MSSTVFDTNIRAEFKRHADLLMFYTPLAHKKLLLPTVPFASIILLSLNQNTRLKRNIQLG